MSGRPWYYVDATSRGWVIFWTLFGALQFVVGMVELAQTNYSDAVDNLVLSVIASSLAVEMQSRRIDRGDGSR